MQLFVYIVESLRQEDIRNSNNLALGEVLAQCLDFMDINREKTFVRTKGEFIAEITTNLYTTIVRKQAFPILHFIMHGNEHCIQFSNGEIMDWVKLKYYLSPLIEGMMNNLLICMCSCYGFSGCQIAMHLDGSKTFGTLIGNDNQLGFNEGLIAYQTFYHHLLKGSTIFDSVEAMKIASKDKNFRYITGMEAQQVYLDYITNQAYEQARIRIQQAETESRKMYFLSDFSNQNQ